MNEELSVFEAAETAFLQWWARHYPKYPNYEIQKIFDTQEEVESYLKDHEDYFLTTSVLDKKYLVMGRMHFALKYQYDIESAIFKTLFIAKETNVELALNWRAVNYNSNIIIEANLRAPLPHCYDIKGQCDFNCLYFKDGGGCNKESLAYLKKYMEE